MVKFYPFKALRPLSSNAAKISSEPYDVISTAEAREAAKERPDSFLHVIRSEIDLPESVDVHSDPVYQKAAENLEAMIRDGSLVEDEQPGLFIYRQVWQQRRQVGIVGCCDVADYDDDTIKKHEKTRPDKEDDRTRHMLELSAHAEPVFLTFRDDPEIIARIETDMNQRPIFHFVAPDGVTHTGWRVEDPGFYVDAMKRTECLYIADGHHRSAGAARAAHECAASNPDHDGSEEYNRFLAVLFPAGELNILAYNRVVRGLDGFDRETLLQQLGQVGDLSPTTDPTPPGPGSFCIYMGPGDGGGWHLLTLAADSIDADDPIGSLDVSLLQDRILAPLLGIEDPRTDPRIDFVGGIRGTEELQRRVDSGDGDLAVSMHPTSIEQLLEVSDAGKIMPPKSTWFEPKLRSGLFIHSFQPTLACKG
ncbi:MAG: hypothetical protein CMJ32_10415 [Phycisphaerae bacterium]|nr:hypothetical protein [Phycisphaerae bacterium]